MEATPRADLVLEGGGVRGIGLVGAIHSLAQSGYTFPRVAGTSAGAIVGSLVAALQKADRPLSELDQLANDIDYSAFADKTCLTKIPVVGGALSLLITNGLYKGDFLEKLVGRLLAELGVKTFGDLRTGETSEQYRWSLVVTASDLSRRRLVRIPWDLEDYGVKPDEFSVARAVRASAAVPYAFAPVGVNGATWVDGGLLSNFPVELFDRLDGTQPHWPTFGVRLSARPGIPPTHSVHGPVSLGLAAIETMLSAQDAAYVDDPCTVKRTIFVPAQNVSSLDFNVSPQQKAALYAAGVKAGNDFLSTWNFAEYLRQCGPPLSETT